MTGSTASMRIRINGTEQVNPKGQPKEKTLDFLIALLTIAAVSYNALLAFAAARGVPLSQATLMWSEGTLLAAGLILVLCTSFTKQDLPSAYLAGTFLLITLVISLLNETIYPDPMRNIAIIALFSMLGARISEPALKMTIFVLTLTVLLFLIIEIVNVPLYVEIFKPAHYYFETRGVEPVTYDDRGLFGNALGFSERFSFGLTDHRTASIFIEQVSLANYAAVLLIYIISMWKRLNILQIIFLIFVISLIILTNSTRTSLIFAVILPIVYFLAPHVPRFWTFSVFPIFLIIAFLVSPFSGESFSDDFLGRINYTVQALKDMDFAAITGLKIANALQFADSGYTYVIYSSTIFGLLLLWAFVAGSVPQNSMSQKRCAYALCLLVGSSLMVMGTSIFTIKVAAPLWLVVGYMARQGYDRRKYVDQEQPKMHRSSTIRC